MLLRTRSYPTYDILDRITLNVGGDPYRITMRTPLPCTEQPRQHTAAGYVSRTVQRRLQPLTYGRLQQLLFGRLRAGCLTGETYHAANRT